MTDYCIQLGDDWTVTTDDTDLASRRSREGYAVKASTGGEA
jgi:hypothetical protein